VLEDGGRLPGSSLRRRRKNANLLTRHFFGGRGFGALQPLIAEFRIGGLG